MLSEIITALFASIVIASTSVCASFGAYADDELKGVVNKGESSAFYKDKWVDVCEIIDDIRAQIKDAGIDLNAQIDNFPIRGYTEPAIDRFAGSTRFDTAAKISSESKQFEQCVTVIIANGMDHADALASGVYARSKKRQCSLHQEHLQSLRQTT